MRPRPGRLALAGSLVLVAALGTAGALRACSVTPATGGPVAGDPPGAAGPPGADVAVPAEEARWELPLPSPAAGWRDAAETVSIDLRRFLVGRPRAGAFEEARAEAARGDLALFPPDPAEVRRMLLSPDVRPRTLALAALAARAEATDDLLRIVLRSQRPEDDDVVRLLGAELVAGVPAELLARHEDDLLRAFEREANPLVLAVALPALERMEDARLRALLESQLALCAPEMLPVLVAIARDRLGPGALREAGVVVLGARE